MTGQRRHGKEPDELLRELFNTGMFPDDSLEATFNWWPGHPPWYPFSCDSVFAFDYGVQGWVPYWFPPHHWSEVDAHGTLRRLSEEERATWFHLWLLSDLELDAEWKSGDPRQRAIRVGWALRAMAERVHEGWSEDWWHPDTA